MRQSHTMFKHAPCKSTIPQPLKPHAVLYNSHKDCGVQGEATDWSGEANREGTD